jgi:hypothetical protein
MNLTMSLQWTTLCAMRLLTWNCCRGPFEEKFSLIESIGFDIAVLQECPRPRESSSTIFWAGENPKKGIAVIAGPGYRLLPPDEPFNDIGSIVPIQVSGPEPFFLLAVWTKREPNYVEPLFRAAEEYAEKIAREPTVIMGDFNSNAVWDRKHRRDRNHSALVSYLSSLGLVSSYHHYFREQHGKESRPTIYFRWSEDKPYHIDFCFIPKSWADSLKEVTVGDYLSWKKWSDHRPLIVDVDLKPTE